MTAAYNTERLLALLKQYAYREGQFTLASGKTSDFFIDCKQVLLTGEGHALAGSIFLNVIGDYAYGGATRMPFPSAVAGVALGGCPLASAVSLLSTHSQRLDTLDALYVRKAAKDHGTQKLVEGRVPVGSTVVLLEDVVTTGGSTLAAVKTLTDAGYTVVAVLVLVDRCEGGMEAVRAVVPYVHALYTRHDFIPGPASSQ